MSDPYTIRIFVPDGDPEGVRIIDRMNWTGIGLTFPRQKWSEVKQRSEFERTGVYILHGYIDDDDLPAIYIGQADGIRNRINTHYQQKEFWDSGIVFVSASNDLNRAHVTWLEYALLKRASKTKRSKLENSNLPSEPALSEAEKADTQGFLNEIIKILPLVGIRVFEYAEPVATPKTTKADERRNQKSSGGIDTVVVPAHQEGFEDTFLGDNCWYSIRISGGMLDRIKYIAAYQTAPTSAITHYAPVDRIESYGDSGKYKLIFSAKAEQLNPIPYGDAPRGMMQSPRYTNFEKLKIANDLTDLFKKS